jgi:hypothetical protein
MSNDISGFSIGDFVIMQNATYYEEWNEMPAVVVSGLNWSSPLNLNTLERIPHWTYKVQILNSDGLVLNAAPHQMRRLIKDPECRRGKSYCVVGSW